ncbi:MAG: TIGR04133 family radical SAM/SPASM protein [Bacteroidales bacterium]|nr:TIGR04133 family radical SAM/SPASM protein [Bacteroidales bacterium]
MSPALFRLFRAGETHVHELSYLFWECTTRCNLHCRHCGSDCSVQSREKDMPLADFLQALDTVPAAQRPAGFTVILTGGEPLLRPDLAACGQAIRERGCGWGIVSNGFHYNAGMQQRLLAAGLGSMTISLDGLEESHNWMRGNPKSFTRALAAIRLAAAVPRFAFDVVTCVHKRNLTELPALHALLSDAGVRQWRLFTIIPIGRAREDADMHLSDAEFVSLMDFIRQKRRERLPMKTTFSCEGYLGRYEQQVRDTPYFCRAGINIASVLIDGRICACPNIDRDVFSQGSIYTDNFYEVWEQRFEAFRKRDWAKKGICAGCGKFRDCLGNGMHNWHGACEGPLNCHYRKTLTT